jgi:hypothetical protein
MRAQGTIGILYANNRQILMSMHAALEFPNWHCICSQGMDNPITVSKTYN